MNEPQLHQRPAQRVPGWAQPRIWHFIVLVMFVAIAITDIREQRIQEPVADCSGRWRDSSFIRAHRLDRLVGNAIGSRLVSVRCSCSFSMQSRWVCFFLVATIIYLMIAHAYRTGQFRGFQWPF